MDRSCTDILCCLIFVAFLVGMVGACGYGYLYGNPALLTTTWDGDRYGCGYNTSRLDYPYLYFPMIDYKEANKAMQEGKDSKSSDGASDAAFAGVQALMKFGTCVKSCPRYDANLSTEDQFPPPKCKAITAMEANPDNYENCVYYFNKDNNLFFRYDTELVGGKFCLPSAKAMEDVGEKVVEEFQGEFNKFFGDSGIMVYVQDIINTKEVLFYSLATAFVVGFIYMIVLRVAGGPIIYLSILMIILSCAGGGYMLFEKSQ